MEALSEATERLSEIMISSIHNDPIVPEVIEEAIFYIDMEHQIRYYNTSAVNLVQKICSTHCTLGKYVTELFPFLGEILNLPEALLVREIHEQSRFLKVKKITLNQQGANEGTLLIIQDLTELKEKERELILKSVAIQEIHHRVKNNLQTIASLIRLQMRRGIPKQNKKYFQETLTRILSIASVYEITLSESSTDYVNVDLLIQKICNTIVYTEEHEEKNIEYIFRGINLHTSSNKAVTLALIVNELILNSVKHAFRGKTSGKIEITFQHNDGSIQLQVSDNGIGYLPQSTPSFGLDIVSTMVEYDLNGSFTINRKAKGTVATVLFPQEGIDLVEG